jgi:hypothetical protein
MKNSALTLSENAFHDWFLSWTSSPFGGRGFLREASALLHWRLELETYFPADEIGRLAAVIIIAGQEGLRYNVSEDFKAVDDAGAFGRKQYREIVTCSGKLSFVF